MLRIYICNNQQRQLEIINEYITAYIDTHTLESVINEHSHPDKLPTAIEAESFHLYPSDIIKPIYHNHAAIFSLTNRNGGSDE